MLALLVNALLVLFSTTASAIPVYDTDGNELRPGARYYISSILHGSASGDLALRPKDGRICPYYVAQIPTTGVPVNFYPANPKDIVIDISTDVNVGFTASTVCNQSTVWKVGLDSYSKIRKFFVGTGGAVGNPGKQTVSNWFRIVKEERLNGYKLVFCPTVCETCQVICGDLGIIDDGGRYFGFADHPLLVRFRKSF